jgi:hypothetical protein
LKKKTALTLVAAALMAMASVPGFACDFCMLSQGISPLDTIEGTGIKISERYTLLDRLYQGSGRIANDGTKEVHWTTELTGFYGVTPEFMAMAVLPYKDGRTSESMGAGSAAGLGDIALLGRYTFVKSEAADATTVMAGLAGIKFATGNTNAKANDGTTPLDSHLQPGTGSTDYLLGLSYSHSFNRFSLSANMLGTIATEGKFGSTRHQFGNALNYDVTGKYRIVPEAFEPMKTHVFAALGVNGEVRQQEKEDGVAVPESGGNTVYLSPRTGWRTCPTSMPSTTISRARSLVRPTRS